MLNIFHTYSDEQFSVRFRVTNQRIKSFCSYQNIKGGMKENLNGPCLISYFKLPCSRRLFSHTEHLIM